MISEYTRSDAVRFVTRVLEGYAFGYSQQFDTNAVIDEIHESTHGYDFMATSPTYFWGVVRKHPKKADQ